jgi:hypothetical protein
VLAILPRTPPELAKPSGGAETSGTLLPAERRAFILLAAIMTLGGVTIRGSGLGA